MKNKALDIIEIPVVIIACITIGFIWLLALPGWFIIWILRGRP